ncbi:MAG TPA: hypothetical protein DDZ89_12940 [Clostridiales bacterium]|nr:hypothetical protein [Clostridiales bacterium]
MSKSFNGRVVTKGNLSGTAAVAAQKLDLTKILEHQALQKDVEGKILCLPSAAVSNFGGLYLLTACKTGHAPAAMLFSDSIDTESASGILLASNWLNHIIIAVDQLGQEFLNSVKSGSKIEIKDTGEVIVS